MFLDILILILLVSAALWTVMCRSLLRSAIGLALTSAILTLMIFKMNAPLAAVFELSVCAGLIPVLFISVISLTQAMTKQEVIEHMKSRLARFWGLPLVIIILGLVLGLLSIKFKAKLPLSEVETDPRLVMWHLRQLDLLGQIIILFTGVFGVVVLFKERKKSG
ncbi:MAG: NADH-quinone oxidoreductase subunit J [Candidatus Omnitrophota bacterium]